MKEIEIPEGCVARIEGNKVIIEPKESEDKRIKDELISFLRTGQPYFCPNTNKREEWANWVERQKEQKPAEWSEEDEEMIDYIIHVLSNNTYVKEEGPAIYAKEINWLKSLHPQPKQEWSKEDKDKIESIKVLITTGKFVDINTIKTIWKLLDSLRPQSAQDKFDEAMYVADKFEEGYEAGVYDTMAKAWKPTEEQITTLSDLLEETTGKKHEVLLDLYQQLKQL